jgi:hypothetical protein
VSPEGALWTSFHRTEQGYLLRFPDLADFAVEDNGRRIKAWPAPGVAQPTIEHLYRNQVLPLAWSRQGKLVLHGSAVDIDGAGVAFIGRSGQGKSTLAASLAKAGSGVGILSDDGLVLEVSGNTCQVAPNHPTVRLWQDSQHALGLSAAAAAPPVQYTSKARILAGRELPFCTGVRPLRRVFFLGEGLEAEPAIRPMKPAQALVQLVRHAFMLDADEREILSAHFDALSRLVALPLFFSLDYPRQYGALAQVNDAIVQHARQDFPNP